VRRAFFFVALLLAIEVAIEGRAACRCPKGAISSHVLVTTPANRHGGLVACGDEDGRHGKVVYASEFQVFRCGQKRVLVGLPAEHSVTLEPVGDALRVTEIATWPFGPHWKEVEIPVAEWFVDSKFTTWQEPRPRLPQPRATKAEVRAFVQQYRDWLASPDRDDDDAGQWIGRLFAASVSGDAEARRLFLSMSSDVRLRGDDLDDDMMAEYDYRIGVTSPAK